MKITRRFTKPGQDALQSVDYERRTSRISNPDGTVVFEMTDAEIPRQWSQLATDIMVSKYFRKAGVPLVDESGNIVRDASGKVVTGPEKSAKQVVHRLAGCWREWGESHGYFDSKEDAQAFYDEIAYMLLHQMCAPNSPQWFNTGLNWAYGITGPAQGHYYCDPKTGELLKSKDAYSHPQPHACQPWAAPVSTPHGPMPIGKIVEKALIGLEVYDGRHNGEGTTHVVAVRNNGQKEVFRVILEGGAAVEATGDHLIYCLTNDGLTGRWVRVDALEKGHKLLRAVRDRDAERAAAANLPLTHGIAQHDHDEIEATLTASRPRTLREIAVKRVESIGTMTVYDIQTESGQYLSNNVVVHNCFIQSVRDDLVGDGGIMDLWTREARLFKYGSGTGSNFSKLRGDNEPLSGGGKSSGLMSFLKIGDRAAGAIKSGGTTRRAAKMVCLDLDHPDVEMFVNWKVREELKVAAMAEGIKHLAPELKETAKKLGLKLDYDFNGEAYSTVSGQNSNNSVRIPNSFFKALEEDGDWKLTRRTDGKVSKTIKARELWDQIAYAAWRCADPGVQYDTTINQWHTCPKSGRINASNPCVTGDTRVLTPGGIWRRIDQMIHLPARVITNLDGQEIHITDGAFPTGTKEVFELRTEGGYSVKLTADHKLWTRRRGWVEAKDLQPSDEVKLPSQPACVEEVGEPQDEKFFQLLGLFLSGTNGNANALHLDACIADADLREEFTQYVIDTWGERIYADDYVNRAMVDGGEDASGGAATATLTNKRLMNRLKAFIRTDVGHRQLSDEAFTAGLPAQKHLLRALFSADGIVSGGTVILPSDNVDLLHDLQMLLLGFGVQSAVVTGGGGAGRCVSSDSDSRVGDPCHTRGTQSASSVNRSGGSPDRLVTPMPGLRPIGPDLLADDSAGSGPRGDAESRRHGLRIDHGSLRSFETHVGLLPGKLARQVETLLSSIPHSTFNIPHSHNWDRVASLTPLGKRQVFDLTEPTTSSFIANGLTVHNCSEYMFLDDTACNLASLNVLTFFDAESRRFDLDGYKHGVRLWTIVLEISVLMASFPSERIAELSYRYRTLGLGYANLGAMLMQAGIPYDSDKGRAICAALTAILTGESYATSADMAREHGPFPGYDDNKPDMLRVMRNHRRAAYNAAVDFSERKRIGMYEGLDILPVAIEGNLFASNDPLAHPEMLRAARECWDRAVEQGERHGYRNAQVTCIAPTGTIGLLMDCDTTGVEPDFALVKFKKLAGGGYFKIANQSLPPALRNLGYDGTQVHEILKYVMGTLTLHDAPHLEYDRLLRLGFTREELDKVEAALPGTFEIGFAFTPWTIGADVMKRLEIEESEYQAPGFNLLRRLGFTKKQIDEANDVICGRGTGEGAPHLREEHYPVFDCANKCGRHGRRFIAVEGHIRMMAAAQPFISGAISKTINLPNEASVEDIKNSYKLSYELGLKANALYRDGSKLSQPLNVKSDEELDKSEDDDEEAVEAAKDEVAADVARAATIVSSDLLSTQHSALSTDNLVPVHTQTIERIVERIVERPLRRRLPDTRRATTHKFDVAGHEGYITVGLYEDDQPGEVFIRIAKEGSTIGGLMDTIATLVSVSLQYGVPVESLVRKFEHVRFEPSGMTRNPEIPIAKSLVDYIFRWMAMEFVPGYRANNAPKRENRNPPTPAVAVAPAPGVPSPAPTLPEGPLAGGAMSSKLPTPAGAGPAPKKKTNGHHPRMDPDTAKPFSYANDSLEQQQAASDAVLKQIHSPHTVAPEADPDSVPSGPSLRLAIVADPLSQQGTEMQADAPACDVCGSITVRSGTCYKCLNCGNSMGCS